MPAESKAQQRFMGMVHARQQGERVGGPAVAAAARSMNKSDAKDFASTKTQGLPLHKKASSPVVVMALLNAIQKVAAGKDISVRGPDVSSGAEIKMPAPEKLDAQADQGRLTAAPDPKPDVKSDDSAQARTTEKGAGLKWADLHTLDHEYLRGMAMACQAIGVDPTAIMDAQLAKYAAPSMNIDMGNAEPFDNQAPAMRGLGGPYNFEPYSGVADGLVRSVGSPYLNRAAPYPQAGDIDKIPFPIPTAGAPGRGYADMLASRLAPASLASGDTSPAPTASIPAPSAGGAAAGGAGGESTLGSSMLQGARGGFGMGAMAGGAAALPAALIGAMLAAQRERERARREGREARTGRAAAGGGLAAGISVPLLMTLLGGAGGAAYGAAGHAAGKLNAAPAAGSV